MKYFLILFLIFTSLIYANSTNKLIAETSPYLQRHAHNLVNWYPWGKEALDKAKKEHKPIFLSIGYSTCHWCHVMEQESFKNKKIAKILNKNFISIKIDREEYPHLDKYYQNGYILIKNHSGGWPLTAVLTEDVKLFFIATYIPDSDRYNQEGLETILPRLVSSYKNRKKDIFIKADKIDKEIKKVHSFEYKPIEIDSNISKKIYADLLKTFDKRDYGFSVRPKFPESSKIELIFDLEKLGVKDSKDMALNSLRAMALNALYDQVDGGFFRYCVDEQWEVPHFEKMLYTNAQLIELYVKAYDKTGDKLYKRVVTQTIKMINRFLLSEGVYFSAIDADNEGTEGGYYRYSYDEIDKAMRDLSVREKDRLKQILHLDDDFNDNIVLNFYNTRPPSSFFKIRNELIKIRKSRGKIFIDKKINTAWNSMMIKALFSASKIDKEDLFLARQRVEDLLDKVYIKGVLYHQRVLEKEPKQKALLEDFAFLISALIDGYEYTFESKYLFLARKLTDEAIKKFYDGRRWYLSDDSFKIYADMSDKYYSAPVNIMLLDILKIAVIDGDRQKLQMVKKYIKSIRALIEKNPAKYPSAMRLFLREKRGYIVLKASKKHLKKNIKLINSSVLYPFVLLKVDRDLDGYLACDMNQCFAIDKSIRKVIKTINKR